MRERKKQRKEEEKRVASHKSEMKLTKGRNELRVNVIVYVSCTTGVNCSIFGYISNGEIVPDVITTLLNRSKTGAIAKDGSRQLQHCAKVPSIFRESTPAKNRARTYTK